MVFRNEVKINEAKAMHYDHPELRVISIIISPLWGGMRGVDVHFVYNGLRWNTREEQIE